MNSGDEKVAAVIQAWNVASKSLDIELIAPYVLHGSRRFVGCAAFLQHFGGPHGMVIGLMLPPNFEIDANLVDVATEGGLFYSFVNVETYSRYDGDYFKQTLRDWNFFGPCEKRPSWFDEK